VAAKGSATAQQGDNAYAEIKHVRRLGNSLKAVQRLGQAVAIVRSEPEAYGRRWVVGERSGAKQHARKRVHLPVHDGERIAQRKRRDVLEVLVQIDEAVEQIPRPQLTVSVSVSIEIWDPDLDAGAQFNRDPSEKAFEQDLIGHGIHNEALKIEIRGLSRTSIEPKGVVYVSHLNPLEIARDVDSQVVSLHGFEGLSANSVTVAVGEEHHECRVPGRLLEGLAPFAARRGRTTERGEARIGDANYREGHEDRNDH